MADHVVLIAGFWARTRYLLGYRRTQAVIGAGIVLAVAGGVVWQYPSLEAKFFEVTGFQTPAEVAEAEAVAAHTVKLENEIEDARALLKGAPTDKAMKKPVADLATAVAASQSVLKGKPSSEALQGARNALKAAVGDYQDAEREHAAQTKKKAKAKEAEAAKKKKEEAARREEAARQAAQAEELEQSTDPATDTSDIYIPPSTDTAPPPPPPAPPTPPPPAPPALAYTSMSLSCSTPESVTFVASGGGNVTLSVGGQSTSGYGSAALIVTVSSAVTVSASGEGSIGITVANGLYTCG